MEIFDFINNELKWRMLQHIKNWHDNEDLMQEMCEVVCIKKDWFERKPLEEQIKFISRCAVNRFIDKTRYIKKTRFNPKYFTRVQQPEVYGIMELKQVEKFLMKDEKGKQLLEFCKGASIKELQKKRGLKECTALGRNRYARHYLKKSFD